MAVRQQQRRGTAAQWTAANPILSAAEIGFEIDTNKFKIGDGINRWADLVYFTADAASALNDLIDGAPDLLNTLNELAAAIGDDASFFTTVTSDIATAKSEAEATASNALAAHESDTTNIHGIANTANLATKTYADSAVSTAVSALTKSSVGLGNVDNTSDANKPIPSATQTALDAKLASATAASTYAPIANPTFTGTVAGVTKSMVGLGNVDNTTDANKPVSTATQTALDLKADSASPALTGTPTAPTASYSTNSTQLATTAFVKSVLDNIGSLNLVLDGGGVN
jgi:hypothetical protein